MAFYKFGKGFCYNKLFFNKMQLELQANIIDFICFGIDFSLSLDCDHAGLYFSLSLFKVIFAFRFYSIGHKEI